MSIGPARRIKIDYHMVEDKLICKELNVKFPKKREKLMKIYKWLLCILAAAVLACCVANAVPYVKTNKIYDMSQTQELAEAGETKNSFISSAGSAVGYAGILLPAASRTVEQRSEQIASQLEYGVVDGITYQRVYSKIIGEHEYRGMEEEIHFQDGIMFQTCAGPENNLLVFYHPKK